MAMKKKTKTTPGGGATEHTIQTGAEGQRTPGKKTNNNNNNNNKNRKKLLDYWMHLKHNFKRRIDSKKSTKLKKEKMYTGSTVQ